MFCKKCGSEISESNETCPKCGTFLNDKFATEEYDPLLALDKVENVEDNVIWQEAPLGDDAIILNAENVEKSSEPLIKESNVDGSFVEEAVEKIENEENNLKRKNYMTKVIHLRKKQRKAPQTGKSLILLPTFPRAI